MEKNKVFAVVGLGKFGYYVATTLAKAGVEVIACDMNEDKVKKIAELVTSAYVIDATDEKALIEAGINEADVVVISIGRNIEASLLVVVQLMNLGCKNLIVKAVNELHGLILEKLGIKRVVYAEREMAVRLAKSLISGIIEEIPFTGEYKLFEMEVPVKWIGKNLKELDLRRKYGISVLAIKRGKDILVNPLPEESFSQGDVILVLGKEEDVFKFI